MAAIKLNTTFSEESSGAIGFSFTGLNDEDMTPNTFSWTLTDVDGVVVNLRQDVVETPAAAVWVVLSGDDLAVPGTSSVRIITVKGDYDTTVGGVIKTGLPYTGEFEFDIRKMLNIP